MKSALESIIRPGHQEIANVADNVSGPEFHFRPLVAECELSDYLSTWADFETALAFFLEEESEKALDECK